MCTHAENNSSRGFTLAEIVVTVALIGIIGVVANPAFANMRSRSALAAATRELRAVFHLARSRAIARGHHTAVKFRQSPDSEWNYAIYDDLDGDGVRNDDILEGIDRRYRGEQPLLATNRIARIALPSEVLRDPGTGEPLPSNASPVRFNRSTLCSFSSTGTGTPGSIFISTPDGETTVVRVLAATGRIRSLRYDRGSRVWRER